MYPEQRYISASYKIVFFFYHPMIFVKKNRKINKKFFP